MAINVALPQWGMNMEEGILVKWLVDQGEEIRKGQPLVEVETSKISSELESPADGVIAHLMAPEGAVVKVGDLVAVIGEPGENPPRPEKTASKPGRRKSTQESRFSVNKPNRTKRTQATPIARKLAKDNNIDIDELTGSGPNGRISEGDVREYIKRDKAGTRTKTGQISPRARRLALNNNIDLNQISGTGPNRRISVADVENAIGSIADAGVDEKAIGASQTLSGLRKTISERMSLSVRTMAQVTLTSEIDATKMVGVRKNLLESWRSHKIRPMEQDILVAAVGDALTKHPRLNSFLKNDTVLLAKDINVGIAMAVPDGLMVPVVNSVNETSLIEIAKNLRDLANKTRKNSLNIAEVSNAGFTITSLMNHDIDVFTPLVDPPQVAILGIGRITDKPVVVDDEIVIRQIMHISVTFDHRALDGVPVAEFIHTLKSNLEDPEWLKERCLNNQLPSRRN